MKTLFGLLLLTGYAYAQEPLKTIRRDSLPKVNPPKVILPGVNSPDAVSSDRNPTDRMPNARPHNSFYRDPRDPKNVMRATLDNMPIKTPDSSILYTMLQVSPGQTKPRSPAPPFLKPMPPVLPRKFPR